MSHPWLMEGTSPAMLSPLHHSNHAQGFEVTAGSHLHVTTFGHPIILDFLSTQVLISQTLQYKNALNAKDSFDVFTAYILLFIKRLMYDTHSSRREELVDGYSYFIINIHYPLLSLICQYLLLPVNSFDFPQSAPCYNLMSHVCKDRRIWLLETGSK